MPEETEVKSRKPRTPKPGCRLFVHLPPGVAERFQTYCKDQFRSPQDTALLMISEFLTENVPQAAQEEPTEAL